MNFSPFVYVVVGAYWVFVLWVMWMVVQSLKGIDASLKTIASRSNDKS
jgi:hypothetical protein